MAAVPSVIPSEEGGVPSGCGPMTLASRGPQFPCSEDLRSLSGQPQWGWLSYPCAPPSRTQLTPLHSQL